MATNAQWTPASTTQTSLTQTGLTPGTSYVLLVRAYKNNSDGTKSYSDYASIPFKASDVAPSGLNALTVNNGTDILLNGGSIFAQNATSPFPTNIGKFNVVTGTTTGTGVILNSTGIGAFKQGAKQFYIDASTGNAYFAGTVQATIIESTGYSSVTDGSAYSSSGTAINLNDGSITSKNFRIQSDGTAYFAGNVSGAVWSNTQTIAQYIGSVAQTAANGKNTIHYGSSSGSDLAGNTLTNHPTYGFGPDGVIYDSSSAATSSTNPKAFPSTISYSYPNQNAGDTFFSFNNAGNIIAQYTASSSSSWSTTTVTSTVIANLDAGKLTAGTIAASIGISAPQIALGGGYLTASYGGFGIKLDPAFSGSIFAAGGSSTYTSPSLYWTISDSNSPYINWKAAVSATRANGTTGNNNFLFSAGIQNSGATNGGGIQIGVNDYSNKITTVIYGDQIELSGNILWNLSSGTSSGSSSSGVKNIKSQSGGTASGGADGDIILIY